MKSVSDTTAASRLRRRTGATAALVLMMCAPATFASARGTRHIEVPAVPAALEAPADVVPFLIGRAEGTQNYMCLPAPGGGVAWRFVAPQATLWTPVGGEVGPQLTTHFLSANPAEGGTPRPTWQHSVDSSRVWGRALASSSDPAYVAPGAIPWLLVAVVGTDDGPRHSARLSEARYIHRVNTTGGAAPSTGCTSTTQIGALTMVPYTADYIFYALRGAR